MTKTQKMWYNWGKWDQLSEKAHPEALTQDAWNIFLNYVDKGFGSWDGLFRNFPCYRRGVKKATKELNLEY